MARSTGAPDRPANPGWQPHVRGPGIQGSVRVAAILAAFSLCAQSGPDLESGEKTAVLYNVARFVTWPSGGNAAPGGSLDLCILGEDPFGAVLDETVRGKHIAGRPLVVRRFRGADDIKGCGLLFISISERRRVEQILRSLANGKILTVSEVPDFARRGGMIGLVAEHDQIQLEVNLAAVRRAGLEISSQLLELARMVSPPAGGGK